MLTSLEYLLPLCGVIVWWSFLWTGGQTVVMKLARRVLFFLIFLFVFALLIKDFWQTGREKKRKKSIGGVVYIDLHSPGVCRQAGWDFSMDSKDNWYKMFTCFGFYFLNHQSCSKRPTPTQTDINLTFQPFNFLLSVVLFFIFFPQLI